MLLLLLICLFVSRIIFGKMGPVAMIYIKVFVFLSHLKLENGCTEMRNGVPPIKAEMHRNLWTFVISWSERHFCWFGFSCTIITDTVIAAFDLLPRNFAFNGKKGILVVVVDCPLLVFI